MVRIDLLGFLGSSPENVISALISEEKIATEVSLVSLPSPFSHVAPKEGDIQTVPKAYIRITSEKTEPLLQVLCALEKASVWEDVNITINKFGIVDIPADEIESGVWRKRFDLLSRIYFDAAGVLQQMKEYLGQKSRIIIQMQDGQFVLCEQIAEKGELSSPDLLSGEGDVKWHVEHLLKSGKLFCYEVPRVAHGDPLVLYKIGILDE